MIGPSGWSGSSAVVKRFPSGRRIASLSEPHQLGQFALPLGGLPQTGNPLSRRPLITHRFDPPLMVQLPGWGVLLKLLASSHALSPQRKVIQPIVSGSSLTDGQSRLPRSHPPKGSLARGLRIFAGSSSTGTMVQTLRQSLQSHQKQLLLTKTIQQPPFS
jgi:hypothetical protein